MPRNAGDIEKNVDDLGKEIRDELEGEDIDKERTTPGRFDSSRPERTHDRSTRWSEVSLQAGSRNKLSAVRRRRGCSELYNPFQTSVATSYSQRSVFSTPRGQHQIQRRSKEMGTGAGTGSRAVKCNQLGTAIKAINLLKLSETHEIALTTRLGCSASQVECL